jgi:hypothetical protein
VLGIGILIFGGLSDFTKFLKQGCYKHLFQALDLSKTNKVANVKQRKQWQEKLMYVLKIGSSI